MLRQQSLKLPSTQMSNSEGQCSVQGCRTVIVAPDEPSLQTLDDAKRHNETWM